MIIRKRERVRKTNHDNKEDKNEKSCIGIPGPEYIRYEVIGAFVMLIVVGLVGLVVYFVFYSKKTHIKNGEEDVGKARETGSQYQVEIYD